MTSRRDSWDVVIAGFGPAGVACANLLGARGVRTLVFERDDHVFPRQRAISIDDEALRIIRDMGLYDEVTAHMHLGVTIEFIGLDGKPFMRLEPQATEACGETQANFFHQPTLEGALRAGVDRFPSVDIRSGWEVTSVRNCESHALVVVEEVDGGNAEEIHARHVLACDGGSSTIRKQLGVAFAGRSYDEQWLDVQGKVKRPFGATPHFRFICDPDRPGVDCPCPGGYHRWEWRINQDEDAAELQRPERLWQLLAERGVTPDDIDIHRHWDYTFHVRCAESWRIGRVLLVGDAAHVMPPFAGQGISGAFRDAANLCWKLDAVLSGVADDRLLDTYEIERRAHHDAVSKAAVRIGRLVMPPNRWVARVRDRLLGTLTRSSLLTAKISREAIRPVPLSAGYLAYGKRDGPVGELIPQIEVFGPPSRRMMLDEALGDGFAVLGLDAHPADLLPHSVVREWELVHANVLAVRPGRSVLEGQEIGDATGRLWNWFRRHGVRVVAVRPDRYVYAAGTGPDVPGPALMTANQEELQLA